MTYEEWLEQQRRGSQSPTSGNPGDPGYRLAPWDPNYDPGPNWNNGVDPNSDPYSNYNGGSPVNAPLKPGYGWEWSGPQVSEWDMGTNDWKRGKWGQVGGHGIGYRPQTPGYQTAETPTSGPGGNGYDGSGAGTYSAGSPYSGPSGFQWPTFTPTEFSFPDFQFESFRTPSMEDAEQEPGYAFALDQGRKALETSAAGRGALRTGGTLKDILEYGQKFGGQNFQNVFNRKFQTWDANEGARLKAYTANRDTYFGTGDRNYRGLWDQFTGKQQQAQQEFQDLYNRWRDTLNATTNVATAGVGS